MYKVIAISGLCNTGKTSFGQKLAYLLGWKFISAGNRFRDYCEKENISIKDIPKEIHLQFDKKTRKELIESHNTIIEGHYLGIFSQNIPTILKVLLVTDADQRMIRGYFRNKEIITTEEAIKEISDRDEREKQISKDLYMVREFGDITLFDEVITNNNLGNFIAGLAKIKDMIQS